MKDLVKRAEKLVKVCTEDMIASMKAKNIRVLPFTEEADTAYVHGFGRDSRLYENTFDSEERGVECLYLINHDGIDKLVAYCPLHAHEEDDTEQASEIRSEMLERICYSDSAPYNEENAFIWLNESDNYDYWDIFNIYNTFNQLIDGTNEKTQYQGKCFVQNFGKLTRTITLDVYDWGIAVLIECEYKNDPKKNFDMRRFKFTKKYTTYEQLYKRVIDYYGIEDE